MSSQRAPDRGPARPTLGVDVGGVIVRLAGRDEDTSFFGTRPLETPEVDGVFETLAALTAAPFAGRVHIVSKAGPKVAANTRAWLVHHDFFARTGIPEANVHFVRERRDKAPVCERLGVTHFVDDHLAVLAHLDSVEHRYLFLGGADEPPPPVIPPWATVVHTWGELAGAFHGRSAQNGSTPRSS
ncbi:hypothetical protein [Actinoplanes ianthinogenes]|nr:hypothetical protein [Actinoplanes ianthinogenes]